MIDLKNLLYQSNYNTDSITCQNLNRKNKREIESENYRTAAVSMKILENKYTEYLEKRDKFMPTRIIMYANKTLFLTTMNAGVII